MKTYIRIELVVEDRTIAISEYKITKKTTISALLKKLRQFLEETAD